MSQNDIEIELSTHIDSINNHVSKYRTFEQQVYRKVYSDRHRSKIKLQNSIFKRVKKIKETMCEYCIKYGQDSRYFDGIIYKLRDILDYFNQKNDK